MSLTDGGNGLSAADVAAVVGNGNSGFGFGNDGEVFSGFWFCSYLALAIMDGATEVMICIPGLIRAIRLMMVSATR